MTRCDDFYCKIERDGNFCNMDRIAYQRTVDYIGFCRENDVPLGTLSERAARPLIKEKDPVVKAKVIQSIRKDLGKSPKRTVTGVITLIQNQRTGKSNQGGDHKGASIAEDKGERKFGDYVNYEKTNPEESDPIETCPYMDNDVDDTGDIPVAPEGTDLSLDGVSNDVMNPKEIEEDTDFEEEVTPNKPELTEKVIKERIRNAGHVDEVLTPERIPSENDKQAIFEKCVTQASKWGMDGSEIARRMRIAIIFVARNEKGSN